MPRVLVLRHVPHEHLGTFSNVFNRLKLPFSYLDVWKPKTVFPQLKKIDALVIMGGPMGVYEKDRFPFLGKELLFIKKCLTAGKPMLGICLGSQLIAHALGSRVFPNPSKEIGWYPLRALPPAAKDPVFSRLPRRVQAFQWHGDTFHLPRGAVLMSRSPLCRNQAFRFRDNVYGLQFHPEVDGPLVREWLSQPGAREEIERLGPRAFQKFTQGMKTHMPGYGREMAPFLLGLAAVLTGEKPDELAV